MIRIHRGPEPAALPEIRKLELKRIRPLALAGTVGRDQLGNRYSLARDTLRSAQHYKCCYCEKNSLEASHSDVEHYRPAIREDRGPGHPDHGYWWLAWTWNNLMFACPNCNRSAKGDQFPLDKGGCPLKPEEKSHKSERPLLVDPCRENPLGHVQFRPVKVHGKLRWFPFPRAGSLKGQMTIKVLKLDRPDLLDLYDRHVEHHVALLVARIETAIAEGDASRAQDLRVEDVADWIHPTRPFTALSYDVFSHAFPSGVRRKWKLKLRQPK